MELDDFRQRWKAPATVPAEAPATEQTLRTMLTAATSQNPLLRLKKNACKELTWVMVAFGLNIFNALVFARHSVSLQRFVVGVSLMLVVVGVIVYRRLQVIWEMEQQQENLFDALKSRIARFRHLMRLHDYVGVVFLFMLALTVVVVRFKDLLAYLSNTQPAGNWHLLVAASIALGVLGVIYAAYLAGKREHQRRYGRYLDQLETALRELEAPT